MIDSFRKTLQDELIFRQERNPSYSQRCFARDLQISPSLLNEVLKGHHGISGKKAKNIAKKLGLDAKEKEIFQLQVEASCSRSKTQRLIANKILNEKTGPEIYIMSNSQTDVLEKWYNLAILEFISISHGPMDLKKIEKKFQLTASEVEASISCLLGLGFIEKDLSGFKVTKTRTKTSNKAASRAIRKFHFNLWQQGLKALDTQSISERASHSAVISLNKNILPEAIEKLAELRSEFCDWIEKNSSSKDLVYGLSLNLFNLIEGEHDAD